MKVEWKYTENEFPKEKGWYLIQQGTPDLKITMQIKIAFLEELNGILVFSNPVEIGSYFLSVIKYCRLEGLY